MSEPPHIRKLPPLLVRRRLLVDAGNRCVYCCRPFGAWEFVRGRMRRIRLEWDHAVPWCYSQNNYSENFLPACNFCNGWKHATMFRTLDEAQVYLAAKWKEATRSVQSVRSELPADEAVERLL